jgi:hypothetical protein
MLKIKIPWIFIRSTITVLVISLLGSTAIKSFGGNFWASFALFFTFQYILFSFFGNIIKNYFIQKTIQKELDSLEPLSTLLDCSYCNKPNVMTFLPDQRERAEFVCTECNKTNLVNIQFFVSRITEPVNVASPTGIPSIQTVSDEKE